MTKINRVLVTGGAGFIGSHVVDELVISGASEVVVVDNFYLGSDKNLANHMGTVPIYRIDAGDFPSMSEVTRRHSIDTIINLAVVPLPTSLEFPSWTVSSNVAIATVASELLRTGGIGRLVHLSSSEAFGSAIHVPMAEDHPLVPTTPYAASKAAGDMIVDSYRRTFDLDARVVRPFNNYGPRQNAGTYAGIIPIVIDRLSRGLPIEIFGDGKQTRDFTFVRDSAAAILKIAQLDALPFSLPLNVATGQETTILSLVKKIAESMNLAEPEFHFMQERIGDVRRHCADTSAFSDLLGYSIEPISVPKLAETAEWYLAK